MRFAVIAASVALAACAAQTGPSTSLQPADPATAMIAGGTLTMRTASSPGGDGQDPLVTMTLARSDGRSMMFTAANHAPYDTMAQTAGGPLAQVMGLDEAATPTLYSAREGGSGAPFICGPEGARMLGMFTAPNGDVTVVGLKSGFEFEPRNDGGYSPLPYSPDHVCARLKFHRG